MELKEIRNQIDRADEMLLMSFATRMRLTAQVANYKKENGAAVEDPAREAEKLDQVRRVAPGDIEEECVKLYNTILEISKDYQRKLIEKE